MSRTLRTLMLLTDLTFILYWLVTALHWIPPSWAFNGYENPILVAWNWSFLPLDLLVSASGLGALHLYRKNDIRWRRLVLVSLTLTMCSGLQAISYWTVRREFDIGWWIPNMFLLIYPIPFIRHYLNIVDEVKR
jgi:hypothetical protein